MLGLFSKSRHNIVKLFLSMLYLGLQVKIQARVSHFFSSSNPEGKKPAVAT